MAGVSLGSECILAWAVAVWPPSWHGQRLPLQRGLGFPSGCLVWNVYGNLRPWEKVRHVGACSVVEALTFGLDVAAVAAHRVWASHETLTAAHGKLGRAPGRAGSGHPAEAWFWNETEQTR